jgi:hypothetical protein
MKVIAMAITYGRADLCELIACWARQTITVPLVLCFDGVSLPVEDLPPNVHVHRLPDHLGNGESIGPVRAAAVDFVRRRFELTHNDAFLVLDDDDYYHPQHAERTTTALRNTLWTGARRYGLQRGRGQQPELMEGLIGQGAHPTWGIRLAIYDEAGGYTDAKVEDIDLRNRMGPRRCASHTWCTHVRRECGLGMSNLGHDRHSSRAAAKLAEVVRPAFSAELQGLETWCTRHLSAW